MATASDNPDAAIRMMEEGLSCHICYNLLKEPKDLDCPHVYCLLCLQEWVKKKPTIECPECRYITIVPKGGLANLKTNLRLKNMVDNYVQGADKRIGVPICPNHDGERQHFFCVTCGITVCRACLVLEHPRPQHDIKELKVITKTQKEEIKTKMDHVQKDMDRMTKEKQQLSEMERELQAAKEKARSDIKKRAQQVVSEIETRMMALVEANYQKNMSTVQEKQSQTEEKLSRLQNVHSTARNIADTAADHNLIQQTKSLVDQMETLCLMRQNEAPSLDLDSLVFHPGSKLQDMSWFGHVFAKRQPLEMEARKRQSKIPLKSMGSARFKPGSSVLNLSQAGNVCAYSKKTCKLKLISEFGGFRGAQGVAATRTGLLAVVDLSARNVCIYLKDKGDFKHQYNLGSSQSISKLNHPRAVALTSEGKFLVCDDGRVKVFSPEGRFERSWPESVSVTRITTTPDDMIVIGSYTKRVSSVYQSNGELIRTHQIDCKNIEGIASNGKQIAFTTGIYDKVCVIDFVTGQTLWTVDMVRPFGICYEQESNTLLVSRKLSMTAGLGVIEQYCSATGHLISCLASGLWWPLAITTTDDNKLVAADEKTVKVYQIEYE